MTLSLRRTARAARSTSCYDGNVDDTAAAFCVQFAREHGDVEGERLAEVLARMTTTQRLKLSRARHD